MSVLDELGVWLCAAPQSHGTLDADLFLGTMPDDPAAPANVVTALYATPGAPPAEVFTADAYLVERVQVVCRGRTYPEAMTKAEALHNSLHGISNQTIGARFYQRVRALQSRPFPLGGPDEKGRWRAVCNYEVWRSP